MTTLVNEPPLETMSHLGRDLAIMAQLVATGSVSPLSVAGLWLLVLKSRHDARWLLRAIERKVKADGTTEADPEEELTNRLYRLQHSLHALFDSVGAMLAETPRLAFTDRFLFRRIRSALKSAHESLGMARIHILEHDAECSPVVDGSYSSAEALITAIKHNHAT
ncbi:MAG: hypothetical protein E6Q97_11760 [Desulfurellales bacterium]|nr:MAG: hypothetical protein E6Q97_11760 [Desulfurellales bacterium]